MTPAAPLVTTTSLHPKAPVIGGGVAINGNRRGPAPGWVELRCECGCVRHFSPGEAKGRSTTCNRCRWRRRNG